MEGSEVLMPKTDKYAPSTEKKRALHVTVYDLQGGPLPPQVEQELESVAFNLAQTFPGLAISTTVV
jgi:hypothetical protein